MRSYPVPHNVLHITHELSLKAEMAASHDYVCRVKLFLRPVSLFDVRMFPPLILINFFSTFSTFFRKIDTRCVM